MSSRVFGCFPECLIQFVELIFAPGVRGKVDYKQLVAKRLECGK